VVTKVRAEPYWIRVVVFEIDYDVKLQLVALVYSLTCRLLYIWGASQVKVRRSGTHRRLNFDAPTVDTSYTTTSKWLLFRHLCHCFWQALRPPDNVTISPFRSRSTRDKVYLRKCPLRAIWILAHSLPNLWSTRTTTPPRC
jgi:hypothetical protein